MTWFYHVLFFLSATKNTHSPTIYSSHGLSGKYPNSYCWLISHHYCSLHPIWWSEFIQSLRYWFYQLPNGMAELATLWFRNSGSIIYICFFGHWPNSSFWHKPTWELLHIIDIHLPLNSSSILCLCSAFHLSNCSFLGTRWSDVIGWSSA
jgi:hypothetical protein